MRDTQPHLFLLLPFFLSAYTTSAIRQKISINRMNDSHVEMAPFDPVPDRASNSGCKCSSECGGEPHAWCRTEDSCGFPPARLAMALGHWDWCNKPRAKIYTVDLTCKCYNKHSHSLVGTMMGRGEPVTRVVTRELRGYWEKLPRSKVGGIGGRGDRACHALCPKICCSAWQSDQELASDKIPMYDGYESCMFDVVGKIGNKWGNHYFLKSHRALTMHEEGYYTHEEPSTRRDERNFISTRKDPEAQCMNPGCSIHTGELSKAYIKGCPANPRAKTAWGEVAADIAMAVGDFITPQWQGPRLGLGNINPQVPNMGGMGGMAAAAYFAG